MSEIERDRVATYSQGISVVLSVHPCSFAPWCVCRSRPLPRQVELVSGSHVLSRLQLLCSRLLLFAGPDIGPFTVVLKFLG